MSEVEKIIKRINKRKEQIGSIEFKECNVKALAFLKSTIEFQERITKLESILSPYLKPNSRSDIDRLEQRLGIIELNIDNIKTRIYHE